MAKQPNKQADEYTLDLLAVAVLLHDQHSIVFSNRHFKSLFKSKKHPDSLFKLLDRQSSSLFKKTMSSVLKSGKQSQFKTNFLLSSNVQYCGDLTLNKTNYKGKPVVQVTMVLKENQTERRKESELLEKIIENSQDVIFHFNFSPKMQLKFISDSSKNILGFSPETIYKNPSILKNNLHEEDRHLLILTKEDYIKLSKAQKDQKIVVRFKHADGKYKFLEIAVNPVYQGKELVGLIGNMRDITTRIETENLLIETKHKFDLITNNANDIIAFYTYYPEEKYLYVSPNIKKILGYDHSDVLKSNRFFSNKLLSDRKEFDEIEKLIRTYQKKNIIKNYHYSFKLLDKWNREVWLENSLVPIANEKGKISFFINILRNITEQKEADIEVETQYINYRNLLDNSPVAYVIHDHGVCLYVNNALLKMVGIKSKAQILGKFALDFFVGADKIKGAERIQDIYKTGRKGRSSVYTIVRGDGKHMELEVKSVLIKFNNKDCILSLVSNLSEQREREQDKLRTELTASANLLLQKEIKERKEIEKSLLDKSAQLSAIFENSTHLIWSVNDKLQLMSFNKNFYDTVKLQHGVSVKQGDKIDELLTRNRNEYINFWYTRYAQAFKGKKLEFDKEDYNNNRRVYRKIFINPIFNENGEVKEISCIANDITDSKIYEQKLINQTGKLSAIFDSSHHYIWTIDREEKLTSFNKNYYDLITTLYNTKPFIGIVLNRGILSNDKEYTEMLKFHYEKAFNGLATSFEIETKDKENKNVYLEIFLNPIYENEKVVEVSGIAHNITEKKHVQQRMELSLKEKEILLREVHHRVKNNMQVISSILNLQSSYVSDEYALTLLKESQNRIKTMAYIHESLYQNKSFTSVNFADYVQTLVNNIIQSYTYSRDKIKVVLNIERITLSLDSSIPAGLIINELITNAIKHAFPEAREGSITLNLFTSDGEVSIELKDDGVGFAPGVDFENSHSLGLQLVNTLIEQIGGVLKFKSEKNVGTEVLVTFKM